MQGRVDPGVVCAVVIVQSRCAEKQIDGISTGNGRCAIDSIDTNVSRVDAGLGGIAQFWPAQDVRKEMGIGIEVVPCNKTGSERDELAHKLIMTVGNVVGGS